jgi:hypothetical protein
MKMPWRWPGMPAVLLAAAGAGCGSSGPGLERVPPGLWGGEHVSVQVTVSDATLQFDCAHGYVPERIRVDGDGRFSVAGVFVREHGGPISPGEREDSHPARYEGSTDGRMLSFEVQLTDQPGTVGPFQASLGGPARLFRCY